jgi:hypothetical protein
MYRKVILSVMTGLLAVAISTGVATADAVKDAQRLNAAKDQVSRDNRNLYLEQAEKRRDIDNFANSVRQNNLGSVTDPDVQDSRFRAFMEELQNVIAIEKDNRVINRQRRQQNWDRLEQGNAQNQLESNFR